MARSAKEATIIVLDVGENTLVSSGKGGTSFFERAKGCVTKIIQKKIFAKPYDEVGLILMGSDDTQNDLNSSVSGFENIVEKIPLQMPTWEMVRTLESLSICDFSSDWVDGLVVALNFVKLQINAKKFSNIRILLVTNFITSTSDSNMDVIIQSIKDTNIEVVAISDCVEHTEQMKSSQFTQDPGNSTQTSSQRLYMEVIKEVGGHLCHIDLAEAQLLVYQKRAKKPTPWNVELSIGSKLKIEVSAYVSIEEEKFLSSFKTECVKENTVTKLVTEHMLNNKVVEKPDPENVINAYQYGSSLVPLADEATKVNNEKCLSCLGFTKRELVLEEYRTGKNCHVVLPRKDNNKSATLLASLVEILTENNHVMIARKVYNKQSKPMIVALLPDVDEGVSYFTMIQLAYSNDIADLSFPTLRTKKNESTAEQKQAIKEFIETMDLMNAADNDDGMTEAFAIETTLNPVNQHLCRSVAYRALHPSEPLPKIDPELVAMLEVPTKLKKASKEIVERIEELFPLVIVERKVKIVFGLQKSEEFPASEDIDDDDFSKKVVAVGTVTPAEDFAYLLKKGGRFSDLTDQLKTVIFDLLFRTASTQTQKILECFLMYREQAKLSMPFDYNQWIKEMKNTMIQRNCVHFWNEFIVKEGYGLISVNESPTSTVSINEQLEFYEVVNKDFRPTVNMDVDEDDFDDLA